MLLMLDIYSYRCVCVGRVCVWVGVGGDIEQLLISALCM